jgi:hypothetical protein
MTDARAKDNALKQLLNIVLMKFGLDPNTSLNITNIIGVLVFETIDLTTYITGHTLTLFSVCMSLFYLFKNYNKLFPKKPVVIAPPSEKSLIVKGVGPCTTILNYMKRNTEFFGKSYIGIVDDNSQSSCFLYPDSSITFTDSRFKVSGKIIGRTEKITVKPALHPSDKEEKNAPKDVVTDAQYMEVQLDSQSTLSPLEYYNLMVEENKKMFETLTSEIMGSSTDAVLQKALVPATSVFPDYAKLKCEFIDSFFSPEKDRIWRIVSTVHFNPEEYERYGQSPCFNALLYGPPGSGKSSFAYRIARALGRNVDNTDLYRLVLTGNLQFIKKLFCYSPNCNKTVFLLDEFDNAIRYLHDQKLKKEKEEAERAQIPSAERKEEKPKVNNTITFEDLLSIFQGSVPVNGRLIFATTNNYETLRVMCPALFRPGRLTPIHFDYLDWTRLNELSQFYFTKSLTFPPVDRCSIPTSDIIELAMRYVTDKDFTSFERELHDKLTKGC